jgi:DNA-binding CsgD family transcriptional regulator
LEAAKRQQAALAVARGSIAELLDIKFNHWGLSPSEREVALFALKGCNIAEIARLRGSAEGTVRSQLSQVYTKAEVTSQSMLIGQFVEELV